MGLFDTDSSAGSNAESSGGSILTRKTGPLPNWVWMALILLLALGFSLWQRNRNAVQPDADVDTTTTDTALDNQTPPPVFILPQNPQPTVPVNVTVNNPANPATPPAAPPVAVKPPVTTPAPVPKPPAKPTPASYATVTVSKYTTKNPPWNSTLWGIAKHYGYGATNTNFNSIWNDPKNAALKKKRGTPTKVQPGDKIYVKLR